MTGDAFHTLRERSLFRPVTVLRKRHRLARAVRDYFCERGFTEVDTPALQDSPGTEPWLHAFSTRMVRPDGEERELFLHTSPEFAMKKLLAEQPGPIFQLAHVFRNQECSRSHHPEFTLLEWYRPSACIDALAGDCQALLARAAALEGNGVLRREGKCSDPSRIIRVTVAGLLQEHFGIALRDILTADGRGDTAAFRRLARERGKRVADDDRWENIFYRLFLDIEPGLGTPHPVILTEFPAPLAALARLRDDDPRIAMRFELYVAGLELANAFQELSDPVRQRERFLGDRALKRELFGTCWPMDEEVLAALPLMGTCAGIALGFDRLVMLATGAGSIGEILSLPVAGAGGDAPHLHGRGRARPGTG